MIFVLRKIIEKNNGKMKWKEIGDMEGKLPGVGKEIKYKNKNYIVDAVTLGEINYIDVV
jgi:hypothetical protein